MPLLNEIYLLRQLPLFAQLTPEELLCIAQLSEEIEVPAGTVLFEEGDPGDAFYLVRQGDLVVQRGGAPVAELHARDCFGETALLDGGVRSATVVALTDCELSLIPSSDFHDLLATHPSIARGMLTLLARRLNDGS